MVVERKSEEGRGEGARWRGGSSITFKWHDLDMDSRVRHWKTIQNCSRFMLRIYISPICTDPLQIYCSEQFECHPKQGRCIDDTSVTPVHFVTALTKQGIQRGIAS